MNWNEPSVVIVLQLESQLFLYFGILSMHKIRKKLSLKVRFSVLQQMTSTLTGGLSNPDPAFSIKVTNARIPSLRNSSYGATVSFNAFNI